MQALYDNLSKYNNFKRYDECFVTSLLMEGGRFAGLTLLDMASGEFFVLRGKALAHRFRRAGKPVRIHHVLAKP